MRYIILLIAALWMAAGIVTVYDPANVIAWMAAALDGWFMRASGGVALLFGIAFLVASSRLRARIYLIVLGLLSLLKGLFFLFAPIELCRGTINLYAGLPIWAVRTLALASTGFAISVAVIAIIALFEEDVI